jgi:hypothetical protein
MVSAPGEHPRTLTTGVPAVAGLAGSTSPQDRTATAAALADAKVRTALDMFQEFQIDEFEERRPLRPGFDLRASEDGD